MHLYHVLVCSLYVFCFIQYCHMLYGFVTCTRMFTLCVLFYTISPYVVCICNMYSYVHFMCFVLYNIATCCMHLYHVLVCSLYVLCFIQYYHMLYAFVTCTRMFTLCALFYTISPHVVCICNMYSYVHFMCLVLYNIATCCMHL